MISHLLGVPYWALPRAASAASGLPWPPKLIVMHDTGNTAPASGEAQYAATRTDARSNWTSAHFYVDTSGPLGSVPLTTQAWAAYSYANSHGWHIEMCGKNTGDPNEVPGATIRLSAQLVARLCDLAGIPKVKLTPTQVANGASGICGHWDITVGLGVGSHDDPGPRFDWAAFIRSVTAATGNTASTSMPISLGDDMPNDALPAGFGIDENDDWIDTDKAVAVPLPAVGAIGPGWGPAWLYVAATGDALVRYGAYPSGTWGDISVSLVGEVKPMPLPGGTTQLLLCRKRKDAVDIDDSAPVRWHVQYGTKG